MWEFSGTDNPPIIKTSGEHTARGSESKADRLFLETVSDGARCSPSLYL